MTGIDDIDWASSRPPKRPATLRDLQSAPLVMSVAMAGWLIGSNSRTSTYEAVKAETFPLPTFLAGTHRKVSKAAIEELLGTCRESVSRP